MNTKYTYFTLDSAVTAHDDVKGVLAHFRKYGCCSALKKASGSFHSETLIAFYPTGHYVCAGGHEASIHDEILVELITDNTLINLSVTGDGFSVPYFEFLTTAKYNDVEWATIRYNNVLCATITRSGITREIRRSIGMFQLDDIIRRVSTRITFDVCVILSNGSVDSVECISNEDELHLLAGPNFYHLIRTSDGWILKTFNGEYEEIFILNCPIRDIINDIRDNVFLTNFPTSRRTGGLKQCL